MSVSVLLVSSGGGHATQARLLRPAFQGHRVTHVIAGSRGGDLDDCSLATPWRVPRCFWQSWQIMRRERANLVVSTGALPGLIMLIVARGFGAQAIWVDSVANAKTLSLSGKVARKVAHRIFSQWPDIAEREGVRYAGAVL